MTISVSYELLELGESGSWNNDGTIVLYRPETSNSLDKIKFRDFNLSIRNDIANLTPPNITAKLCANLSVFPTNANDPTTGTTPDPYTQAEMTFDSHPFVISITNQSGTQTYQPANNYFDNQINNEVTFSEFDVPLVTSFEDSINNALNYAKYKLSKILGLYNESEQNLDLYNSSLFIYGNFDPVALRPWTDVIEDYTYINAPYNMYYNISNYLQSIFTCFAKQNNTLYRIDYRPFRLDANELEGVNTFILRKAYSINAYSSNTNDYIQINSTSSDIASPWGQGTADTFIAFGPSGNSLESIQTVNTGGGCPLSVVQNGAKFTVSYLAFNNASPMTSVNDLKQRRNLQFIEETQNADICHYGLQNEYTAGQQILSKYYNMLSNNRMTVTTMFSQGYYLLSGLFFKHYNTNIFYFVALFANSTTVKCLIFDLGETMISGINMFPAASQELSVSLRMPLACFENDWTVDNYIQYSMQLNQCQVCHTPLFILPLYTDGSNDFLYLDIFNGTTNFRLFLYSGVTGEYKENFYYNNFNLFSVQYNSNTASISGVGPVQGVQDKDEQIAQFTDFYTFGILFAELQSWYNNRNNWPRVQVPILEANQFPVFNSVSNYEYQTTINTIDTGTAQSRSQTVNSNLRYIISNNGSLISINLDFQKIYNFAESTIEIEYGQTTLTPLIPTIGSTASATGYSWGYTTHINNTLENPYYYAADSTVNFFDNIFTVDANGNIKFPCLAVGNVSADTYGLLTFFVKLVTNPAVFTFDPNIKQLNRIGPNIHNAFRQFNQQLPSLYYDTYPFNQYIYYVDQTLYNKINVLLSLRNTDTSLRLLCSMYPTVNNIVFRVNETSMISFKEMKTVPSLQSVVCQLIDATGQALTLELAKNIYASMSISIDWDFLLNN